MQAPPTCSSCLWGLPYLQQCASQLQHLSLLTPPSSKLSGQLQGGELRPHTHIYRIRLKNDEAQLQAPSLQTQSWKDDKQHFLLTFWLKHLPRCSSWGHSAPVTSLDRKQLEKELFPSSTKLSHQQRCCPGNKDQHRPPNSHF